MLTSAFYESGTYLIALNADIACLTNVPLVIMAINIILYVCVCVCVCVQVKLLAVYLVLAGGC